MVENIRLLFLLAQVDSPSLRKTKCFLEDVELIAEREVVKISDLLQEV